MAYVPLLYSLGWPGMESLPCVVVDHVTRDVYSNSNKLPLNKLYLNTTANKYVELSSVLKLFPSGKDKDAMHNFMTISSEFGMRKFFMDRFQRAYISLDTLLVYMIVYPYCPEFLQARSEVARYLQSYRELPCCRCGFIKRDCRCSEHLFFGDDDGTYDIVGYATGQVTQETQTQASDAANQTSSVCNKINNKAIDKNVETKTCSTQTWIAPPSQKCSFVTGTLNEKEKPSVKITPINVVAPMKSKVVMVDAACQTRANFDFNLKSRVKAMPSSIVKETENSGASVFTINNEKSGEAGNSVLREGGSSLGPILPTNTPTSLLVPKQPLKISLWKLLDSDSSDDEFTINSKDKGKAETSALVPSLPKTIDFSNEPKESNTTENLTEMECSLLLEAEKVALSCSSDTNTKSNKDKDTRMDTNQTSDDSSQVTSEQAPIGKSEQQQSPVVVPDSERLVDEEIYQSAQEVVRVQKSTESDLTQQQASNLGSAEINQPEPEVTISQGSLELSAAALVQAGQFFRKDGESGKSTSGAMSVSHCTPVEDMDTSVEVMAFEALSENKAEEVGMSVTGEQMTVATVLTEVAKSSVRTTSFEEPSSCEKSDSLVIENKGSVTHEKIVVPVDRSGVSDKSQAIDDNIMVTDSKSLTTDDKSLAADDKSPLTDDKSPATDNKGPATDDKGPATDDKGPATDDKGPATDDKGPATDDKFAGADDKITGINDKVVTEKQPEEGKPLESSDHQVSQASSLPTSSHLTNLPPNSGAQSVSKITDGADLSDKSDLTNTGPLVIDCDGQESPVKTEEKPEKSYKKWCHKFEYTPTTEKLYRCTFLRCGQCFDTKKAAVVHNKVHGPFGHENPTHLVCFKCDYVTGLNKWFDIVRHLKFTHNELITSHQFGCYLCGRDFDSSEKLNKHIDFHYSGRYKCVHCGSVLFTWKQVEEHVKEACEAKEKKEKNLGCPYCPLVFHIRNMRNAHMLSHHDKGLVCAFCDDHDLWENWKQLRKHYQQKHPTKIRSSLNPHRKSEPPEAKPSRPALQSFKVDIKRNPLCPVCEDEFEGDEDLFYHMSRKHDFVPYVLSVCEICEKTFRTQKMYDWHMRNTHTEDIKCDRCSFVAKTQALLKSHMQTRHQDREHACVECGKDFAHYRELRMHMARHALHTIYCCDICGEEFKRQRELRHHNATVHPKQNESLQQECLECDYRCYTRRAMEAHVRKHHPKLAEEIEECENEPAPSKPPKPQTPAVVSVPPTPEAPTLDTSLDREVEPPPLVIAKPPRERTTGSKKSRKKLKRLQSSEPRILTDKEEERRRLKRQRKEQIERLRVLVKVSSARTRTYEDFKDMLALNLIEHPQEQTIDHEKAQVIHSEHDITEPAQKRQKVSKYGRSIVTKALDDIYVSGASDSAIEKYVEQPQHLHEKQRRADAQKRRRVTSGLFGVLRPISWSDEVVEYPFSDHCYFELQAGGSGPPPLPQPVGARSVGRQSAEELDVCSPPTQTLRIGPGGVTHSRPHTSRKQTLKLRPDPSPPTLPRSGEFLPLHSDYGPQDTDIQEEIINQELMREVSEIAQQDPVLQDLINSMQQGNANNILTPQQPPTDMYSPNTDSLLQPATSRAVTPPKSLNLNTNMQLFDPTASPGNYQGNLGQLPTNTPTKNDLNLGTGLTPTKQNVLDFLMSKLGSSELEDIDVNDDELKLLLNEHMKAEQGQLDGPQKITDPNQEEQKKVFDRTDVLSMNPQLPSSISEMNEIEEFVTADGRIVRGSGGSVSGVERQPAAEIVKLDNPDISSITPLVASQPPGAGQVGELSKEPLSVHYQPVLTKTPSNLLTPTTASPTQALNTMSQSSGIDALLEASEMTHLSQLPARQEPYQAISTESAPQQSGEQITFLNQEGHIISHGDIDVCIEQEISTQAEMLQSDGSDTDSSPDKDNTDTFVSSPFESEFEKFVKVPNQGDNNSTRESSGGMSLNVGGPVAHQPHKTPPLVTNIGKQQIVVRHVLQEPASVSVVSPASQRMIMNSNPGATTVKLIRGSSQKPGVVNYSKPPVVGSGFPAVAGSAQVEGVRQRVVHQFERGRSSAALGGTVRPGHRVVRLTSPVSQTQGMSAPRPSYLPAASTSLLSTGGQRQVSSRLTHPSVISSGHRQTMARPSHLPPASASILNTGHRHTLSSPRPSILSSGQRQVARPGTKIIRIIQRAMPPESATGTDQPNPPNTSTD